MLTTILQKQIDKTGDILFSKFMQAALYHPEYGYYMRTQPKIAPDADFITAPTIGNLFARSLSVQLKQVAEQNLLTDVLEYGAGTGQLAYDLLSANPWIKTYIIVEVSPYLRKTQETKLASLGPQLQHKIIWLQDMPSSFSGIVIANEIIDAFAVARFHWQAGTLYEQYVTNINNKLSYQLGAPSFELKKYIEKFNLTQYFNTIDNYCSEANLALGPWIKNISQKLTKGAILIIDYGFKQYEYYHPDRNEGTLIGHYKHQVQHEFLQNPGKIDITSHVDFTALASFAVENDLEISGYTNLASFLLNLGILKLTSTNGKSKQETNLLLAPHEMGELFKVIMLEKNLKETSLLGFSEHDKTHTL